MTSMRDKFHHHVQAAKLGGLPATTGINSWYESGGIITPKAFDTVMEVMKKDMLTAHRADGKGRFRPSNLGGCPRMQVISYHGVGKDFRSDPSSEHLMGGGTWGHYRWQLAGLSKPFLSGIEVKVVDKALAISGSMDGVMTDGSGFELKTTNIRRFTEVKRMNEPFHSHIMQATAYMRATGIEVFSIVYEHRDSGEFLEYRVPMTDNLSLSLQMEVGSLVKHAKDGTLPEMREDCAKQEGTTFKYCSYRLSCPLMGDRFTG